MRYTSIKIQGFEHTVPVPVAKYIEHLESYRHLAESQIEIMQSKLGRVSAPPVTEFMRWKEGKRQPLSTVQSPGG